LDLGANVEEQVNLGESMFIKKTGNQNSNVKGNKNIRVDLLLFVIILLSLGFLRGAFDYFDLQNYGYISQYGILAIFIGLIWLQAIRGRISPSSQSGLMIFVALLFVIIMFSSWLLTIFINGFYEGWIYLGVMLIWTCFFTLTVSYQFLPIVELPWSYIIAFIGITTAAIGLLQEARVIPAFPGTKEFLGIIRPSALLGSMQHYAIALSIVCLYLIESYLQTRKRFFLWSISLIMIAVFASLTRSGYIILIGGLFIWVILAFLNPARKINIKPRFRKDSIFKVIYPIIIFSLISFTIVLSKVPAFSERLGTIFDPQAAGNPGRIESWEYGLTIWRDGPILIGNSVGLITQSTDKIFPNSPARQVESGVIQQLANFGFVGTMLFYGMFLIMYISINNDHYVLRATIIACIFQSFFYMSIETFPFMLLIGICPIISNNIKNLTLEKSSIFIR
jgi:hypothetical protein